MLDKIKSVTDTPAERVAHSLQAIPARQCPTPFGPGRNDPFHGALPIEEQALVWAVMAADPGHILQCLTKR